MKIIVVGCTHAGTAAIIHTARLYPEAEITVYERNDNISFLSCGIALNVQGVVKDPKSLFYSSPEALATLGVKTFMLHDVTKVDTKNKTVTVTNLTTGDTLVDAYDKMIVTCGSWPIIPNIPGVDLENVMLCKNYDHAKALIEKTKECKSVAIVGAGYIGVELVEAFHAKGLKVVLIDRQTRIMSQYLDQEFTTKAQQSMQENGITLALGEIVQSFEQDGAGVKVVTDGGAYNVDMAVLCIGFRPNTPLFQGKLDMLANGAIIVDQYMRTSDPDIMAAGDSAAIVYNPTGERAYIPLATNAVRMGTLAAYNLLTPIYEYIGTQSTSGIKIFENNFAATGLTQEGAKCHGIDCQAVVVVGTNRPAFMPSFEEITLKVVYETTTKVVLGAQLISKADCTDIINTMSVVIQNKMTMPQLAMVDQFFQPHFNNPWGTINLAGLAAL